MLDVGDGQHLYYEVRGNPDGKPAVVLHGGPGSGATAWWAGFFDPERYRVVLFDQRGAGRSTPPASDPDTDLSVNTTPHLVADIERLRQHVGVDRWLVIGASWGATLAQAYAIAHPDRVSEMVLFAVTTTRPAEVEWITRGVARFFPEAHARLVGALPPDLRTSEVSRGYARMLASPDAAVRQAAADAWCAWEEALATISEDQAPSARYADPVFRYGFARLVTHYFSHGGFLADDGITGRLGRIGHIPAVLVHGRFDLGSPPENAWRVARGWPAATLRVVEGAGHTGHEAMSAAVVAATDAFAGPAAGR